MRMFLVIFTFASSVGFTGSNLKQFTIEAESETEALKKANERHNRFNRAIKCEIEELR